MISILAIESSAEACSVAVSRDGNYFQRYEIAPQQHAKLLMGMIDDVMAEAELEPGDLTGLAYGHGPGSFTGVRIAAATIQGLAMGLDLHVAGISTLQALAHRAWREYGYANVVSAIDARMQEVYLGAYQFSSKGTPLCAIDDAVSSPETALLPTDAEWVGVGSGWNACDAMLLNRAVSRFTGFDHELLPHALDVAVLGEAVFKNGNAKAASLAMPVYLRDKVALTEKERAAAKAAKENG